MAHPAFLIYARFFLGAKTRLKSKPLNGTAEALL